MMARLMISSSLKRMLSKLLREISTKKINPKKISNYE